MQFGAVGLLSRVSRRFVHEVIPVALASVVGMLLVNHYARGPTTAAVVAPPPAPPPAAEALVQTLQDEHRLVAGYLEREADANLRKSNLDVAPAPRPARTNQDTALAPRPALKERPSKERSASKERRPPLPPVKPASMRRGAPLPPLPAIVPEFVVSPAPRADPDETSFSVVAGSMEAIGAARDWVVGAVLLPTRTLAPPLFEAPPIRPIPVAGE